MIAVNQSQFKMVFNDGISDQAAAHDIRKFNGLVKSGRKVKSDLFTPSTQFCSVIRNMAVNPNELSMRLNSVAMFGQEPICIEDDSDKLNFLTEIKKTPKMVESASKFGEKKRSSR